MNSLGWRGTINYCAGATQHLLPPHSVFGMRLTATETLRHCCRSPLYPSSLRFALQFLLSFRLTPGGIAVGFLASQLAFLRDGM